MVINSRGVENMFSWALFFADLWWNYIHYTYIYTYIYIFSALKYVLPDSKDIDRSNVKVSDQCPIDVNLRVSAVWIVLETWAENILFAIDLSFVKWPVTCRREIGGLEEVIMCSYLRSTARFCKLSGILNNVIRCFHKDVSQPFITREA